jgi:RecJ-like exonuclease
LLQDLKEFASSANTVVIADIAIDELYSQRVAEELRALGSRAQIVYIDHHPLPEGFKPPENITFIHDVYCSASELTFRFFHERGLDAEFSRVALYGAISDYLDETPWVRRELLKWDRRSIFLEAGIVSQGLEGAKRDHNFKRSVVKHLAKNLPPSQMQELVARAIKQAEADEKLRLWVKENVKIFNSIAYVINPPGSVGRAANYARIYTNAKIGIAAEERGETLVMSLRGDGSFDLNKILRKLSKELGIHGGGHPVAAGARMPKSIFQRFLEELSKEVSRY